MRSRSAIQGVRTAAHTPFLLSLSSMKRPGVYVGSKGVANGNIAGVGGTEGITVGVGNGPIDIGACIFILSGEVSSYVPDLQPVSSTVPVQRDACGCGNWDGTIAQDGVDGSEVVEH